MSSWSQTSSLRGGDFKVRMTRGGSWGDSVREGGSGSGSLGSPPSTLLPPLAFGLTPHSCFQPHFAGATSSWHGHCQNLWEASRRQDLSKGHRRPQHWLIVPHLRRSVPPAARSLWLPRPDLQTCGGRSLLNTASQVSTFPDLMAAWT